MDGWVVISTKLDSKQLEKDLKSAERRLQQYEKEAEKLTKTKVKTEIDLKSYEEQKRIISETTDEINKYAQTQEEVQKNLNFEKTQLEELNTKYSSQLKSLDEVNRKIKENAKNQALVKTQIAETTKQLNNSKGIVGLKDVMRDIGKETSKAIKNVTRYALAVFGIRSAYMAVRRAIDTISQQDEQLATDIEYMKNALAYTLEPLVRKIVELAKQLMFYVAYIIKAWTGRNIFENANKSLENANSEAKKLSKTLAGFDEMNILSDTSSSSGGGVSTPSFDLTAPEDIEAPSWIRWIAENKDIVISGLAGIASGLTAVYLGLTAIQGLGIGLVIAGVVFAVQNLIKFLKNPAFESFMNIFIGIGVAITGVGVLITSLPVVIAGAITAAVALIVKNYDFVIGLFNKMINWFEKDFVGVLRYLFGPIGDIIAQPFIFAINYLKGSFEGLYGGIKKIVDGIVKLFKGDFKSGITSVFSGLKSILLAPINALISGINSLIRGLNKISFDIPDWIPKIGGKKWGFNIPQIPKLAVGGIVNMPGRGINYGGANIGENGAEGVIPLTDTQAMETLGATIGKYININFTNITKLDNRQIAREQKKINAQNDFAFNR